MRRAIDIAGKPFAPLIGLALRSFQTKFLALVLVGVLVPSGVLWLFTVRDTEQYQRSRTRETFSSVLGNTRKEINYWYKDRTGDIERLIRSNAFLKPYEQFSLGANTKRRAPYLPTIWTS